MKEYASIERLAEDVGVSERSAWRWLKRGGIKKKRSSDGRVVFILNNTDTDRVVTDITDTDMSRCVTTDKKSMSVVSKRPIGSGRQFFGRDGASVDRNRVGRDYVSASLDAIQVLNRLRAVTSDLVNFIKDCPSLITTGEEEIFCAIHKTLGSLYERFKKDYQFSDLDLREAFDDILEARRLWDQSFVVVGDELESPEGNGFCRSRADLEKDSGAFDSLLESIKFLLVSKSHSLIQEV